MADKMTLDEAIRLAEGNTADLPTDVLAKANKTLRGSFRDGTSGLKAIDAMDVINAEAEARIRNLSKQDSFDAADLDAIVALASTISGFSQDADLARAVRDKANKQKENSENNDKSNITSVEAIKLVQEKFEDLSIEELAQINKAFEGSYGKHTSNPELSNAMDDAAYLINERIVSLSSQDNFAPEELDAIMNLVQSSSILDKRADLAKEVLNKAIKQKTELDVAQPAGKAKESEPERLNNAILAFNKAREDGQMFDTYDTLDEMNAVNSGLEYLSNYTRRLEEIPEADREATIKLAETLMNSANPKYKESITSFIERLDNVIKAAQPGPSPQQLNEAAIDDILNSDQYTDEEKEMAFEAGIEYNKELDEKGNAQEAEYELGADDATGEVAEDVEEGTSVEEDEKALDEAEQIPEDESELEAFDKEYGIDSMTEEQLNKNAEFMDEMDRTFDPFAHDEEGNLVHPEFQEEYDAFQSMEITDDNGVPLPEDEQKKAKENLKETAMFEAGMLTRGCAKGDSLDKQYKEALKNSLQKAVVTTGFTAEIQGKPLDRETIGAAFVKATSHEGGIKGTIASVVGYAGVVNGEMTKLRDRLQNKFKEIPPIKKMSEKIAAFDKRMTENHPKMWKTAKRVGGILAKRIKSVAIYTAIGAVAGPYAPIAMAGLAAKSGMDAYKGLKSKAEKEGMTLGQYAKNHKAEVALSFATSGLAIIGSSMGVMAHVAGGKEAVQSISPVLKVATRTLAIAPHAFKAAFHGAKAFAIKKGWAKGDVEVEKQAAKEAWNKTVDATIGIMAGAALNNGVQSMHSHEAVQENTPEVHSVAPQISQEEMASTLQQMGLSPEIVETMDSTAMHDYIASHPQEFESAKMMMEDKDHDGKPDYMDADHGQGWATANETQLDRAMDADPKGINEILNDGKWHSSAELKDMMEKGEFTDDQLKAIHGLASKEFDENGKIVDPDLKAHYENLAKEAKEQDQLKADPDKLRVSADEINKPDISNQPARGNDEGISIEPQLSPAEQKMYDAILNTIGKNEDMSNPEIKASVEGMAQQKFEEARAAIAAGDDAKAANIIYGVHVQGEKGELETATKHEEDDGRRVSHAKEDLLETKEKLDHAKEALAKDPDNPKLQKEVEKLEKEFDKDSLKLDNREIKEERSDLKDQIKHDKESLNKLDSTRETIEKNVGMSSKEVDQQLAAAGIDVKNLPEDTKDLPDNVKNLINIHNQYSQVDKVEEQLKDRITDNEHKREDLKEQRHDNKEELHSVKKGNGLSNEAEERLPGQSQFSKTELAESLADAIHEQNVEQGVLHEAKVDEFPAKDKPLEAPVYKGDDKTVPLEEVNTGVKHEHDGDTQTPAEPTETQKQVDKFLADEVAKGNMTPEEAKEMAPLLVAKAEAEQQQEQTKEEKVSEKAEAKVATPEVAAKINSVVEKAEAQFTEEALAHGGQGDSITNTDGSITAKYPTMDGTVREIHYDTNGGATISAKNLEGEGYSLKLEPDGTSIATKTDIYGVQTTEIKDASGKVVESNQETKTMEEKLAFRQERLNVMKEMGVKSDKEVNEAMESSRKDLMAEKAKELSGRGEVTPTKPVQQTKLDYTKVGKGKEM